MIVYARPAWQTDAACRGSDPALWYLDTGASARYAKAVCAGCPVRDACLHDAIERRDPHGIWGGLTERQRRAHYPPARTYHPVIAAVMAADIYDGARARRDVA